MCVFVLVVFSFSGNTIFSLNKRVFLCSAKSPTNMPRKTESPFNTKVCGCVLVCECVCIVLYTHILTFIEMHNVNH